MRNASRPWWLLFGTTLALMALVAPTGAQETPSPFVDVGSDHVFVASISWLADQEITRGCNPPANDQFCPDEPVTRGQMAAFLVRAFFLSEGDGSGRFSDDDSSIFETDIERLAARGITRGCNPPANDRFCPDDPVTRGQMAAFLVRAFGYVDQGSNRFTDDDFSVFETDIERLAAAGVTKGCNPPQNDRFCPEDPVTRGQMAAFLHRAFGRPEVGEPGLNRIDPEHTLLPTAAQVDFLSYQPDATSTLEFEGDVDVGDVIVIGATPQTPFGFIGKVVAISGTTVTTEPGSLMDAVPHGQLSISTSSMEPLEGTTLGLAAAGDPSGTVPCGPAIFNVDSTGPFDFKLGGMDIDTEWRRGRVEYADVRWEISVSGSFKGTLGAGVTCERIYPLWEGPHLGVWIAYLGPVPVVITPKLGVDLRLQLDAQAGFSTETSYRVGYEGGVRYEEGVWSRFDHPIKELNAPTDPILTTSVSAEIDLLPRIRTELYGIAGPHVRVGPFLRLDADTGADPWWTLDGGVAASLGFSLNKWLVHIDHDFARIELVPVRLAEADGPLPTVPPLSTGQISVDWTALDSKHVVPPPETGIRFNLTGEESVTLGAQDSYHWTELSPGIYTLTQELSAAQLADGWVLEFLDCDPDASVVHDVEGGVTIEVEASSDVHCGFENFWGPEGMLGQVAIQKGVPVPADESFLFSLDPGGREVSVPAGEVRTFADVAAGTYGLTEQLSVTQVDDGWSLQDAVCPLTAHTQPIEAGRQLELRPNERVMCVFTNTQTRETVAEVPMAGGVAIEADAAAVWVADTGGSDAALHKITAADNEIVFSTPVEFPASVVIGFDSVWVASSPGSDTTLLQVDPVTGDVTDQVTLDAFGGNLAAGDGSVWVSDASGRRVFRVDPSTLVTSATIDVGWPSAVEFGDGFLWVANGHDMTVSRIDPSTNTVTGTVDLDIGEQGCCATAQGISYGAGAVWVGVADEPSSGYVVRLDPATFQQTAVVPVGNISGPVAHHDMLDASPTAVWVVNRYDGTVMRIDPDTNQVTATIPVSGEPQAIDVSDEAVWVGSDVVSRIEPP